MKQPKFNDEKHIKARQYYADFMSVPGNREKTRQQQRKRYAKDPTKAQEYRRNWVKSNPVGLTESYGKCQKKNLDKLRAKIYSQRYGVLDDRCQICGNTIEESKSELEGHHFDYSLLLERTTMCKKCHEGIHAMLIFQGRAPKPSDPSELATHHCSTCGLTLETCGKSTPSIGGSRSCALWMRQIKEEKK